MVRRHGPGAVRLLLALGLVVSTGCAAPDDGDAARPDGTPTPPVLEDPGTEAPAPTGTTASSGPPPPGDVPDDDGASASPPPSALTELDSGASIRLAVGDEVPLRLGSGWSWGEPTLLTFTAFRRGDEVPDGSPVAVTPVEHLVDPGYEEWLLTGVEPGGATVSVDGEPACGDTTVCPPTTVTVEVTVEH